MVATRPNWTSLQCVPLSRTTGQQFLHLMMQPMVNVSTVCTPWRESFCCVVQSSAFTNKQAGGVVPGARLHLRGAVQHRRGAACGGHCLQVRLHVLLHLQGGGAPPGKICSEAF